MSESTLSTSRGWDDHGRQEPFVGDRERPRASVGTVGAGEDRTRRAGGPARNREPPMNYEEHLRSEITRIVREHPTNRLLDDSEPYFEDPLVGFAAANNPLFEEYKQIIGPFHLTPDEVLRAELCPAALKAETVISWVLPVAVAVRRSNRRETRLPSHEWARVCAHSCEGSRVSRRLLRRTATATGSTQEITVSALSAAGQSSARRTSSGVRWKGPIICLYSSNKGLLAAAKPTRGSSKYGPESSSRRLAGCSRTIRVISLRRCSS